jgi:hypothetical protein
MTRYGATESARSRLDIATERRFAPEGLKNLAHGASHGNQANRKRRSPGGTAENTVPINETI